ncbi:hypothetical protein MMC13_001794 [Lambiella insularis]|nr:hypothetical protein [Lambiella insularis]
MAGDDYTLYQAALLTGICYGDPRGIPTLLKKDEASWSSTQHRDTTYWNNLSTMKPFRGLSGDVCQQQTEFLVRELQARLQIKLSEQGSAGVPKAHLVTRQQNMALVFHRFDMRGPNPFRRPDYTAITQLLSQSPLFPKGITISDLTMWMLQLEPYFDLLVPHLTLDDKALVAELEELMATIGRSFKLSSTSVWKRCTEARRRYTEDTCPVAPSSIEVTRPAGRNAIPIRTTRTGDGSEGEGAEGYTEPEGTRLTDIGTEMGRSSKASLKRPSSDDIRDWAKRQRPRSDK